MTTWFVTATGTGVGKTLVTAALCHQLCAQGRAVRALKPVLSGYLPEEARTSDAGVLLRSLGRGATDREVADISPWRFSAPLSPDMAAAREGRSIDGKALVQFCRDAGKDGEILLIEGIGGAMVPIDATTTVLDWIADLGAPSLLVAGSYLGTLSHTLTTIEAMRARGLAPSGLVISESEESPVPLEETAAAIRRFAPGIPTALVPRIPASKCPWQSAPDLSWLLEA